MKVTGTSCYHLMWKKPSWAEPSRYWWKSCRSESIFPIMYLITMHRWIRQKVSKMKSRACLRKSSRRPTIKKSFSRIKYASWCVRTWLIRPDTISCGSVKPPWWCTAPISWGWTCFMGWILSNTAPANQLKQCTNDVQLADSLYPGIGSQLWPKMQQRCKC